MTTNRVFRWLSALAVVALPSCESLSPRMVPVSLHLTDAPAAEIGTARVWLSRAYLVPPGEDGEFHTIFETEAGEEPQEYDLLTLQDGVTALLGTADVPEGAYEQLRLVVDRAEITLAGSSTFADGSTSRTLFVPSGMQTGIKVNFAGPLTISGATAVVIDFSVEDNFKLLGPADAPFDILFTPTLVGEITN